MAQSSIEWTQQTWNPTTGCNKISQGCKFCYAEILSRRLHAMGLEKYANGFELTLHPDTLAIPFRSYSQPLMVMLVIPFGLIGGVLGHIIEGMPLSKLSEFGLLALSGVVVNDSLVLVDFINRKVREGTPLFEAVRTAGAARFRPILLTSITTFAGLFPLLRLESTQAQVLIPMAVSLGYGVLFATFITLFLVPVSYLVLEDIKSVFSLPKRGRSR